MKLNRRAGSQPRTAVGRGSEDLQPKLFDVPPDPADQPDVAPVPHPQQPGEARPVDFEGANEYGLPTQMPLPEAVGLPEGEGSALRGDDPASELNEREEEASQAGAGPDPFLKLIARIAMRAGQKEANQEGGDHESRSVPEGEQ